MDIKDLIKICNTCPYRNKQDNMYFMAWWSHCQKECELLANVEKFKKNFES